MIKKTVTYFDYDNNERTETLYFNLNQSELIEVALDIPDDVSKTVENDPSKFDKEVVATGLVEKMGQKGIMGFVKDLLIKSYGIKSEDGRRFIKTPELATEFSQTIAFDTIFMELMANDKAAADFVNGVIPANVIEKMPFMNQNNKVLPIK